MTVDIAALRGAARKATKGEWRAFTNVRSGTCAVHTPEDKGCGDIVDWPGFDSAAGSKKQKVANAKYIAMVNPATIIALLDQLEAAQARIAELESEQEPFRYVVVKEKVNIGYAQTLEDAEFMSLQHGGVVIPLFTRQSKPVVVLPKEFFTAKQNMRGLFELSDDCMCGITASMEAAGIVVKDGE